MILKRLFDIFLALFLLFILGPFAILIAILVKLNSPGPAFHWSQRIGRNNTFFLMPKFRTMKVETPDCATHLLQNPEKYITRVGVLLRKTSVDELPQILSVLRGDMSFVGPRPALHNQDDLALARTNKNVHTLLPGVTGWSQINGRDTLSIPEKVNYDKYYLENFSLLLDFKILFITAVKVFSREGISH